MLTLSTLILTNLNHCLRPQPLAENSERQFCFESEMWKESGLAHPGNIIVLSEVLRQTNTDFVDVLNALRLGDSSSPHMRKLADCVIDKKPRPSDGIIPTKLYCTNKDVDFENSQRLAEIAEDIVTIGAKDEWSKGSQLLTPVMKKALQETVEKSVPSKIDLKIGAQVMLIRNRVEDFRRSKDDDSSAATQLKLVNGSRGRVVGFVDSQEGKGLVPIVRFDCGREEVVGKVEFEVQSLGGEGTLVRYQVPLKLAW